jgi:hypothetical protein
MCAVAAFTSPGLCDEKQSDAEASSKLVAGILARSKQVFSAKLVYSGKIAAGVGKPDVYRDALTFSGPSWLFTALTREHGNVTSHLSHGEKFVEYTATRQQDGSIRHLAQISLPRAMDSKLLDRLVTGSNWRGPTREFLAAHSGEGKRKADQEVHGVKCQVWEWVVLKKDVPRAFFGVTDLTQDGGLLRLYCAPQLGYVCPRIDKVGTTGKAGAVYVCREYHEDAPGIFLPRGIRQEIYSSKEFLSSLEYTIESIQKVNEPIPDSEFRITLPYGTEVIDSRPGQNAWYKISEDLPLATAGLSDIEVVSPPSFFRRNRNSALALGCGLGLCLVGVAWLWRRSRIANGGSKHDAVTRTRA